MTRASFFLCGLFAIAPVGCAERSRPDPLDLPLVGGETASGMGGSSSVGRYPRGPYGADNPVVGSVIPNLEFLGYFNPQEQELSSSQKYGSFSLQDVRKAGGRLLLIHPAAIWCGACYVEAAQLNRELNMLAAEQVAVLQILVDGSAPGADPSKAELDAWLDFSDLRMSVGLASDDRLRDVFRERGYIFIVDLETMQVLERIEGVQLDPSIVEIALAALYDKWLVAAD